MIFKLNLRRNLLTSVLFAALFIGVTPTSFAGAEMTDAEKALELQRKEEQIRLMKEQARQGQKPSKDIESDQNSKKAYTLPQLRDDKKNENQRRLGNRDLNSTDLKEEKDEENDKSYRYSGLSDRNSVTVNNRLKSKKSGGVVGNTKLNRTKTKKVRSISDKYKIGVNNR